MNDAIKLIDLEPIIITMNSSTLMTITQDAENHPEAKIDTQEDGFEEIVTYNGIPISVNPMLPYGQVIIK